MRSTEDLVAGMVAAAGLAVEPGELDQLVAAYPALRAQADLLHGRITAELGHDGPHVSAVVVPVERPS